MKTIAKVMKYELSDVIRSRWLIAYTLFFLVVTDGLLRFSGASANAELGLLNIVLVVIPLVSVVFGTMHVYNAREFTELLLAQPIGRRQLFGGLYLGLAVPLSLGFVAGVGIPFALHGFDDPVQRRTLVTLLGVGTVLTFSFTGVAFALALRLEDKAKGLGAAIAIWLLTTVLYDGLVLLVGSMFADYSLERPLLALMMLNPVDLGRVLMLLQLDVSALMGYTGAVFQQFLGGALGTLVAGTALLLWIVAPLSLGARAFRKKDF
jgi:Cu-processing system permease protein